MRGFFKTRQPSMNRSWLCARIAVVGIARSFSNLDPMPV
jgi:hypothetical protein